MTALQGGIAQSHKKGWAACHEKQTRGSRSLHNHGVGAAHACAGKSHSPLIDHPPPHHMRPEPIGALPQPPPPSTPEPCNHACRHDLPGAGVALPHYPGQRHADACRHAQQMWGQAQAFGQRRSPARSRRPLWDAARLQSCRGGHLLCPPTHRARQKLQAGTAAPYGRPAATRMRTLTAPPQIPGRHLRLGMQVACSSY